MKIEDLKADEKLLELFKSTYKNNKNMSWDERMRICMGITGKSERTVRKWANKLGLKEKAEDESPEFKKARTREFDKLKKRFIITWAQNNTPVHLRFFHNVEAYAKKVNASVHVIAGRYKNPTSVFTDKDFDFWHPLACKYLDANRHDVHKFVSIMSDIKVQPTAVNPMTGLQGVSGINSCVFGAPRIQMEMIPVLENCMPKMMVTTGACTIENYTDSKAGKKGEFHHNLGFAIVEIQDDETFYIRQVTATDNGDFNDLIYNVQFDGKEEPLIFDDVIDEWNWKETHCGQEPVRLVGKTKIKENSKINSLIMGDIHYGHHDQKVIDKTLEFTDVLKPKHVVLHDIFDGYSISHHEMKDPFIQYAKEVNGQNDLEKEVNELLDGLKPFERFKKVVIVRSNHDDFLDRWLKNEDWRKARTPKNSHVYMDYSSRLLKQYAKGEVKGVIPELVNERYPNFITLGRSDSYKIKGWELGQHGDVGANGSRGSLMQFRKLNTKLVVGHYHSPGRKDNVLAVGTSTTLRVGYNLGPSSWLQSHVIIHRDGKPQHINFIKDKNGNLNFTTLF